MNNNHKNGSGIGSLIVGAAIGAAAATLINKESRKKLKDGIKSALETGDAKMDEISNKALNLKKQAKVKAIKELKKTERKLATNI